MRWEGLDVLEFVGVRVLYAELLRTFDPLFVNRLSESKRIIRSIFEFCVSNN